MTEEIGTKEMDEFNSKIGSFLRDEIPSKMLDNQAVIDIAHKNI